MGMEDDFLLEDEDDEKTIEFIKKLFTSGHERGFLGR